MKILSIIIALFALGEMVNCTWWAAAVQPVILSLGAVFAALDLDLQPMLDAQPIDFKNFFTLKNEENKAPQDASQPDANEEKKNKTVEGLDIRMTDEEMKAAIEKNPEL